MSTQAADGKAPEVVAAGTPKPPEVSPPPPPVATPKVEEAKLEVLEQQRADDDGMPVPPHLSANIPNPRPPVQQAPPPLENEPEPVIIRGGPASAPPRVDPNSKPR